MNNLPDDGINVSIACEKYSEFDMSLNTTSGKMNEFVLKKKSFNYTGVRDDIPTVCSYDICMMCCVLSDGLTENYDISRYLICYHQNSNNYSKFLENSDMVCFLF